MAEEAGLELQLPLKFTQLVSGAAGPLPSCLHSLPASLTLQPLLLASHSALAAPQGPRSAGQGSVAGNQEGVCSLPSSDGQLHLCLQHTDPSHRSPTSMGADSCGPLGTLMHQPNAEKKVVFFLVCCFPSGSGTLKPFKIWEARLINQDEI